MQYGGSTVFPKLGFHLPNIKVIFQLIMLYSVTLVLRGGDTPSNRKLQKVFPLAEVALYLLLSFRHHSKRRVLLGVLSYMKNILF